MVFRPIFVLIFSLSLVLALPSPDNAMNNKTESIPDGPTVNKVKENNSTESDEKSDKDDTGLLAMGRRGAKRVEDSGVPIISSIGWCIKSSIEKIEKFKLEIDAYLDSLKENVANMVPSQPSWMG